MHCSNFMRNISPLIITTMSNGPEQLVAEDEQETIRSDKLKNLQLESNYEISQISPLDHVGIETDHLSPKKAIGTSKGEEEEEEEVEEECGTTSFREEPELVEEDGENNDGFRTPTSLDHKIPAMMQCPPAPMKPKPTRKRKLSPLSSMSSDDRCREVIELDFSEEVESLFRPIRCDEIKKARRNGNNN